MPDTVYFYPEGLELVTDLHPDSEDSDYPAINMANRDTRKLWKPAAQVVQFDIDMVETVEPDNIVLHNNRVMDAGCDLVNCGLKMWTTADDNQAGTGVFTYHVGAAGEFERAVAGDQPTWHEEFVFPVPGPGRRWFHLIIKGTSAANWADNQVGALLLSRGLTIGDKTYNRVRQMDVFYGVDETVTAAGYRKRKLIVTKKYSWSMHWEALTATDRDSFEEIWDIIKGGLYPMLFRDVDDVEHWVAATSKGVLPRVQDRRLLWDVDLKLETEL